MKAPLPMETVLLHSLYLGPTFGLGLIARVRGQTRPRVQLGPSSVYPALRRLARRGLIRSWVVKLGGVGRPRRYYELTPDGIAAVHEQRRVLAGFVRALHVPAVRATARERAKMANRLTRCAEISALALTLRDQVAARAR